MERVANVWTGGGRSAEAVLLRIAFGAALNGIIAMVLLRGGREPRSLTRPGVLHAGLLGLILISCVGLAGWILALVFLVSGSLLTKVGRDVKIREGTYEKREGARGPENVWGAGAIPAAIAVGILLMQILPQVGQAAIQLGQVAYVAALGTKSWDTTASEIGKAFGKTTILLTTFQIVPRGTEGAVSVEGTTAGIAASILFALLAFAFTTLGRLGEVLAIVLAATFANICEAIIGSAFQEKLNLSNEFVNFINTVIGATSSIALALLIP